MSDGTGGYELGPWDITGLDKVDGHALPASDADKIFNVRARVYINPLACEDLIRRAIGNKGKIARLEKGAIVVEVTQIKKRRPGESPPEA